MTIHNSLTQLTDFVGKFSKNALEGATLTGLVTFGPHLFKQYVYPEFTPLLDLPTATACTVAGAIGYSAYQTILDPASSKTYNSLSSIPKKVSDFVTGLFVSKNNKKEKNSLYSTSFWGFGMLSSFGYLFVKSSDQFPGQNPLFPIIGSAAITLAGSFILNKFILSTGKYLAETAKESDLFNKTCEIVDHVWTFGGTTLKLAILGSGIWGVSEFKKAVIDPTVNSRLATGSVNGATSLFSWSYSIGGAIGTAVQKVSDKFSPLSDFLFSSKCFEIDQATNSFTQPINIPKSTLLASDPDYTEMCPDRIYTNMPFINSYIKPTWDFSAKVAGTISSTIGTGYRGVSYGLFLASGLIFRESTLEACIDDFKKDNLFLCNNAERIDSVFINYLNPFGTGVKTMTSSIAGGISSAFKSCSAAATGGALFVYGLVDYNGTLTQCSDKATNFLTNNPSLCSNAERVDSFIKNTLSAKNEAIRLGGLGIDNLKNAVNNPTVQIAGATILATGIGLYSIHFLATKAREYFTPPSPTLPIFDIEQGISLNDSSSDTNELPPVKFPEPSAPPIELMKLDDDLDLTPSAPPIEFMEPKTISNTSQDAPITFWTKLESFTAPFISGVTTWAKNLYTSVSIWWESFWTKNQIDKK